MYVYDRHDVRRFLQNDFIDSFTAIGFLKAYSNQTPHRNRKYRVREFYLNMEGKNTEHFDGLSPLLLFSSSKFPMSE